MVRFLIIFSGRVQGVGFRWTLAQRAYGSGLSGWVRNREDGKVEAQIQGERNAILNLIRSFDNSCFIRINDYSIRELEPAEHEYGFEIID